MKRIVCVALVAFLLTACGPEGAPPPADVYPQGTLKVASSGGYVTTVIPVEVNGVPCIVAAMNASGVALQCDFRGRK